MNQPRGPKDKSHLWKPGQSGNPSGRPKGGLKIQDLLDIVRTTTGLSFEEVFANHLKSAMDKYESGEDLRSMTTLINSLTDKFTESLPKQVNVDHSGKVEHIAMLQDQDKAISERLLKRVDKQDIIDVEAVEVTVVDKVDRKVPRTGMMNGKDIVAPLKKDVKKDGRKKPRTEAQVKATAALSAKADVVDAQVVEKSIEPNEGQ